MESTFIPYIKNKKLITRAYEHLKIFLVLMEESTDRNKALVKGEILLQEKITCRGKRSEVVASGSQGLV